MLPQSYSRGDSRTQGMAFAPIPFPRPTCRSKRALALVFVCAAASLLNATPKSQLPEQVSALGRALTAELEELSRQETEIAQVHGVVERLSAIPLPEAKAERIEFAKTWKLATDSIRRTEGDTELLLEALKIAAHLDPENSAIAADLRLQERKKEYLEERVALAAELRRRGKGKPQEAKALPVVPAELAEGAKIGLSETTDPAE